MSAILPDTGGHPVHAQLSIRGLSWILDLLDCGVGVTALWLDVQAVAQGHMRLVPEVRELLRHLVERWYGLVRSMRYPELSPPLRVPDGPHGMA